MLHKKVTNTLIVKIGALTMSRKLYELFITFAKIGLFTFGGGYAMIAIIENECVEKRKWLTDAEMSTMTAIAESTPGPIAINCATYTGYIQAGIKGAVIATLGMAVPSFVIIYIISLFFDNFLEITLIANAFKGIKIAVGVLIVNAGFTMMKKMNKAIHMKIILIISCMIMLLVSLLSVHLSSVYLLLLAGAVNVAIFNIKNSKAKRGGKK